MTRLSHRDPRLVTAGLALVAFVLAATVPMTALVRGGRWQVEAFLTIVALAAVTVTVRRRTGSRVRSTVMGLGALAVVALLLGALDDTPVVPESWVPTAVRRLVGHLDQGVLQIQVGQAPLPETAALSVVLVLALGALWLLLDLTILGLGWTPVAGLALLALWAPVVVYTGEIGPLGFVLGTVGLLLLLAAVPPDAAPTTRSTARQFPGVLAGSALVAVVALVAAPALASVPMWSSVDPPVLFGLPGGPGDGEGGRLASDLDLRDSLTDRSGRVAVSYTSTVGAGGPLRLYTLTDFDGRRWSRSGDPGDGRPPDGVLWPGPVQPGGDPTPLTITIEGLRTTSVPLPIEPRTVATAAPWRYSPERDELLSATDLTAGTTYQVTLLTRTLTATALRDDVVVDAPGRDHLAVPDSEFRDEIAALAREITAEATDPYSQGLALQSYLRDASRFTYSLEVPQATTADAVWDFLTQRTGYCVQFATAFTVMARSLGLPTRVGVGYLPGVADPARPGTFVVTGARAHAWPEIHFEGAGWVRFEPTPAGQSGPPPWYADPLLNPDATAPPTEEFPEPGPTTAPTPTPTTRPAPTPDVAQPVSPWWLALALVLPVMALVLARRRRAAAAPDPNDPEVWWARFLAEAATYGVVGTESTTPRALGRALQTRQVAADPEASGAGQAVDLLVRTVERARWAPEPGSPQAEEMAQWVEHALDPLRAQVARAAQRSGGTGEDWR